MSKSWTRILPCALAGLLMLAGVAVAGDHQTWLGMPEAASDEALEVDHLIHVVFWLTTITFVGVQALLLLFLVKYRKKPGQRAKYTHGNHTVEMIWTIAPALILVFLALYQMDLWRKMKSPTEASRNDPVVVQIFASQFQWDFRYPGADGEFGTKDDRVTVNELVVPVNRPVLAYLRSMDVLHSFYLPNMRMKQDAVPGLTIPVWFEPTKLSADRAPVPNRDGVLDTEEPGFDPANNYWDIVCAELCGNGHTKMAGKLYVVTADQYEKWINEQECEVKAPMYPCYVDDKNTVWFRWGWQDDLVPKGKPLWTREPFGVDDRGESEEDDEDY